MICYDKKLKFFKKMFFFLMKIYQINAWLPWYVLELVFLRRLLLRMKIRMLSRGNVQNVFLRNLCSWHFRLRRNLGWLRAPGENFGSFFAIWEDAHAGNGLTLPQTSWNSSLSSISSSYFKIKYLFFVIMYIHKKICMNVDTFHLLWT